MKERPILFSAPMIRALLDGTKSQTRRAMKHQPHEDWRPAGYAELHAFDKDGELDPDKVIGWGAVNEDGDQGYPCPYGQPGHRIWVRETFIAYGRWETRFSAKKARDEWHFVDMTLQCDRRYQYATDNPDVPLASGRGGALPGWYTRPAIFMPRASSRILLEIVSVRVERLSDISDADARAEGIGMWAAGSCAPDNPLGLSEAQYFELLWSQINGALSWEANPWVWVVEFKRMAP